MKPNQPNKDCTDRRCAHAGGCHCEPNKDNGAIVEEILKSIKSYYGKRYSRITECEIVLSWVEGSLRKALQKKDSECQEKMMEVVESLPSDRRFSTLQNWQQTWRDKLNKK